MKRLLVGLTFAIFTSSIGAELPPYVYHDYIAEADAVFIIDIGDVWRDEEQVFNAEATIRYIHRTAAQVSIGDVILIQYKPSTGSFAPGPSGLGPLESGETVPAYLIKENRYWVPAARGQSFSVHFWPEDEFPNLD